MRKFRQESRLFLVEGIRQVGEAIQAEADVREIFFAPDLLDSEFASRLIKAQSTTGVSCYPTTAEVFVSMADKENPQGILAVVRQSEYRLADLDPENFPWGVALVSPQDPGNLGAILRTVNAVGASGLLLLESSVDIYHPSVIRASMGTIFWHPVVLATFLDFVEWAQKHAYLILGTSAHADLDFRDIHDIPLPRILLLGSEREGLSEDQKRFCEWVVRIPMRGRATSLNLAVAAGVMLYHMQNRGVKDYG